MKRYWGLDSVRGIAIVLMLAYHFFFDLNYFRVAEFGFRQPAWRAFQIIIGSLFLLVVGISLSISRARVKKLEEREIRKKYLLRGLKIFAVGLLITAATWIYPNRGVIIFGILHMIGLSIILSIPFLKLKKANLALGLIFLAAGLFLREMRFAFPWLLWLGLVPRGFYTLDFYPLIPWFGLVLTGLFIGKHAYPGGLRSLKLTRLGNLVPFRFLSFLGRHSLLIYLLHQPVLVGIILLFT